MSQSRVSGLLARLAGFGAESKRVLILLTLTVSTSGALFAQASDFSIIYTFVTSGGPYGSVSPPLVDSSGAVYGTTVFGDGPAYGTVFRVDPSGTETTLYEFTGQADGGIPGQLLWGADGNLYGYTNERGDLTACLGFGCGTVFKIDPAGKLSTLFALHVFAPIGMIRDISSGTFYGTDHGGPSTYCTGGCGEVFSISPVGVETIIYTFVGGPSDGLWPYANPTRDRAGNISGFTEYGGSREDGTLFQIDAAGNETLLFSLVGGKYGINPQGPLVADRAGNLYGNVSGGRYGPGVILKMTPSGEPTALYNFTGGRDGGTPAGRLIWDSAGNLYGTAAGGGSTGSGVIFKLDPSGVETVLYNFTNGADGAGPETGLTMGRTPTGSGYALYGVNPRVVFRLLLPPDVRPDADSDIN